MRAGTCRRKRNKQIPALPNMQMKLITQDTAATAHSAAAFPRQQDNSRPAGILAVEALTAALWQAMHDYAACLTALTIPGLADDELKKREKNCRLRRTNYLEAKIALETCIGAIGPSRDGKTGDGH